MNIVKALFFLMLLDSRKSMALFEWSQVSPPCPSDKPSIQIKPNTSNETSPNATFATKDPTSTDLLSKPALRIERQRLTT